MEFAQLLRAKGIDVQGLHRSKLESFFRGGKKAAFFRTDKGIVEVIFFPDPVGGEKVHVMEQRKAGRYIYSFKGQPSPRLHDRFDASRPMYFVMHRNLLIVTSNTELFRALKNVSKVDHLNMVSDESSAYLNKTTGQMILLSNEELSAAEEKEYCEDYPEWQREMIEKAREVLDSSDYVELPSKFDIHEYQIMEEFC